ncbi:hypothetical protein J3R30DRAFT_3404202 [Lentinula aciculospora]|uniref:Uncharacterized protein n=1 Tax=Lentinula aciculospora TaxID=153920 RepID=A0A9W9AA81_9AGAR|nr:hypothetical protein J3R30DRAFT_3404202 [Lentinula aciculospora]
MPRIMGVKINPWMNTSPGWYSSQNTSDDTIRSWGVYSESTPNPLRVQRLSGGSGSARTRTLFPISQLILPLKAVDSDSTLFQALHLSSARRTDSHLLNLDLDITTHKSTWHKINCLTSGNVVIHWVWDYEHFGLPGLINDLSFVVPPLPLPQELPLILRRIDNPSRTSNNLTGENNVRNSTGTIRWRPSFELYSSQTVFWTFIMVPLLYAFVSASWSNTIHACQNTGKKGSKIQAAAFLDVLARRQIVQPII